MAVRKSAKKKAEQIIKKTPFLMSVVSLFSILHFPQLSAGSANLTATAGS